MSTDPCLVFTFLFSWLLCVLQHPGQISTNTKYAGFHFSRDDSSHFVISDGLAMRTFTVAWIQSRDTSFISFPCTDTTELVKSLIR